jgi:pimeloyl-ACP methyl ester carboxylesterase
MEERSGETPKPLQRSRTRRVVMTLLRVVVIAYVGIVIVLTALQNSIIFPGAASQGRRDAMVRPFDGSEIVAIKASTGDQVVALFGAAQTVSGQPHPEALHRPTLLYFYGNGMCMADCAGEFTKFRRRGFNVMVPDFVGYGMSEGKPSEAGVYATADAAFEHLLSRKDIDPTRIIPTGWSLGSAAAIHLGSTRKVPCVVVVSAFTSMPDMARRLFPYLPTGLILRHHFDNESKVRRMKIPIFIGHGTRDSIIPFDMSQKLAAAAGGPVTKYDVEGADHNDVYDVGGTGLLDAIAAFAERMVP